MSDVEHIRLREINEGRDAPVTPREWMNEINSVSAAEARERAQRSGITEAAEKDASDGEENKREGLSESEKDKVREAHPDWPDEIIDAIGSWKEYEIYDKAGLKYAEIGGKPCLIRSDIDMKQKDAFGMTNEERMKNGLAPLNKNGEKIELHHIGQKKDSPLAELSYSEHHKDGNYTILHDLGKETEVHGEGNNWTDEREQHWKARASQA